MRHHASEQVVQGQVGRRHDRCSGDRRRPDSPSTWCRQRHHCKSDDAEQRPRSGRQRCRARYVSPRGRESRRQCDGDPHTGKQRTNLRYGGWDRKLHALRLAHCVSRTEKRVRLVHRVREKVQQSHLPNTQAALHQHETHLGARRPRQRYFHAHPRRHHQRGNDRGHDPDDHQNGTGLDSPIHDGSEAEQHQTTQVHHASVEQRRHRSRCFHHLDQPPMEGQLRALQHGSKRDKEDADARPCWQRRRRKGPLNDEVDLQGGERQAEGHRRSQHARVCAPSEQELLVRDCDRRRTIAEEGQQPVQRDARNSPRRDQQQHVVGNDDQRHSSQGRQHPARIPTLMRVAMQIHRRVAHNNRAHETDQAKDRHRDVVDSNDPVGLRSSRHPQHRDHQRGERHCTGGCPSETPGPGNRCSADEQRPAGCSEGRSQDQHRRPGREVCERQGIVQSSHGEAFGWR